MAAAENGAAPTPMSDEEREELCRRIEAEKPTVFGKVVSYSIDTGTVQATRFVLVDPDGKTRAVLGTTEDGQTRFALCRPDSNSIGAELALDEDGAPTLRLNDAQGWPRFIVKLLYNGPHVAFVDGRHEIRFVLRQDADGNAETVLWDQHGQPGEFVQRQSPPMLAKRAARAARRRTRRARHLRLIEQPPARGETNRPPEGA